MPIFDDNLDPEQLPPIIAQIAVIIGIDATEQLINHAGGRNLYIPLRVTGHEIEQAIGEEAARLLVQDYGGTYIKIPRCHAVLRARRNAEIVQMRTVKRWKIGQIARASGLTISRISKILAIARAKA